LGLLLACGCGLDDYEKNMDRERERLEEFDRIAADEARYLDSPLDMPRKKVRVQNEKKVWETREVNGLPDFFLKAPKGIRATPEAPRRTIYPYLNKGTEGLFAAVYLGGTEDKKESEKVFQTNVCKDLPAPVRWNKPDRVQIQGLGKRPLLFDKLEFGEVFFIYFNKSAGGVTQFAIVFEVVKGAAKADVKKALEASLKTFETGSRALRLAKYGRQDSPADYFQYRLQAP
jgi:hypothetical protein